MSTDPYERDRIEQSIVFESEAKIFFIKILKVPMSWLGILHIYNIWNPVIRIAIYLVVFLVNLPSWTFWLLKLREVTANQEE